MYQEYARLVVYRGFPADSIFRQLCSIIREFDEGSAPKYELIDRIHAQIKALLDLSTECGFDGDLWHCYLTWLAHDPREFLLFGLREDARLRKGRSICSSCRICKCSGNCSTMTSAVSKNG